MEKVIVIASKSLDDFGWMSRVLKLDPMKHLIITTTNDKLVQRYIDVHEFASNLKPANYESTIYMARNANRAIIFEDVKSCRGMTMTKLMVSMMKTYNKPFEIHPFNT